MSLTIEQLAARKVGGDGYLAISCSSVTVLEHIMIAERVLGRPLPKKAEVHHINGVKSDNRNSNLVICPDRAYHLLLHRRQRAFYACGNADWRKCVYCHQWDSPDHLYTKGSVEHRACGNEYRKAFYKAQRAKRRAEKIE